MPPKRNVSFTKPEEPAFIKRMKEQIGYQEPPTIETKRELAADDDDEEAAVDFDDEKPVVVVLNPGDLSEADLLKETDIEEKDKKIVFSKPVKKDSEEKISLDCSSKKRYDLQNRIDSQKERKKVKNSSLLSFGDDEDY